MDGKCETNSEVPSACIPSACVFELSGEPAVIINGVPDIPVIGEYITTDATSVDKNMRGKLESPRNTGFGEWMEGREVKKIFDEEYYSGIVTEFDKDTGWYRVVYEDGDFEDLEWHELQDILKPLDITVPLKSLALKMIRKNEKPESGRNKTKVTGRGGRRKVSST